MPGKKPFPWRARIVAREPARVSGLDVEWLTYRTEEIDGTAAPKQYRVPLIGGPDVVVAVVHDRTADRLVMVRQIRPGALVLADDREQPDWHAEVVVGVLDAGRDPHDMIRQEIFEETGATTERLEHRGVVYLNPAGSAQRAHIFYAAIRPPPQPPNRLGHEGETIVSEYLPLADIDEWLTSGRIADTLSVCALALCRTLIMQ